MKQILIGVGAVVLGAGCGAKPSTTTDNVTNRSQGSTATVVAAALADQAKLNADYTCECVDKSDGRCKDAIVVDVPEDPFLHVEASPAGFTYEQALAIRAVGESCWAKLADWEDARGLACLGQGDGPKGARPSCGDKLAYELATVEPWWKSPTPCAKGQYLVTKPNPMIAGALLQARCAEKREFDIEYTVGRVTEWYVHGSVKSDRTAKSRTDWYPHGQKQLEVTTGSTPADADGTLPTRWTHYHMNGQVSDQGQRVWANLHGPWEGFRPDGSLLYRATQEIVTGTTVTWFDLAGNEVPEQPMPPEARAILSKQNAAESTPAL
jgi:hypothetical protein